MSVGLGKNRDTEGPRCIGLSASVGWAVVLVFACGGDVASTPGKTRVQAVAVQDDAVCPEPLEPSFWSDGVLLCTDGSISKDQIPEHVCTDAGLSSCDVLEPVSELDLADLGVEPGPNAEPVAGNEAGTEAEPDSDAEPGVNAEPDTGAEPETESEPDAGVADDRCADFDTASLVAETRDADCDVATPEECPAGMHIDFDEDSPCAVCAEDAPSNRSCAWAAACFRPFIESIAHASGAKSCAQDADCSGMVIKAGCGEPVTIALRALIDEELSIIAEMYAKQNCGLCGNASGFDYELLPASRCVEGVCQLR